MSMIEAQYKTGSGRLVFKVTAETSKQLFERLADLSEVFEAETACGCCNSQRIRFAHRVVTQGAKKFDYYELHCVEPGCRARFAFGQLSDGSGGLFPKRKNEAGYLPNRGWEKYVKPGTGQESQDGPSEWDYSQEPAPPTRGGR